MLNIENKEDEKNKDYIENPRNSNQEQPHRTLTNTKGNYIIMRIREE